MDKTLLQLQFIICEKKYTLWLTVNSSINSFRNLKFYIYIYIYFLTAVKFTENHEVSMMYQGYQITIILKGKYFQKEYFSKAHKHKTLQKSRR
jgi:hypothetical protein